jgi:hypothetical protein
MPGLSGNLRTMPLPDILQWIAAGRKSGTLHITRGAVGKQIAFHEGTIYSSVSKDPREYLGQFLIRSRLISEDQLFKALERQETEGRLLGAILVAEGALSEDDLSAVLRTKAEETIYDLFLWAQGEFEFKEGDLPRDLVVHLSLNVTEVVLEGIRRVDDWDRIRKVIPSVLTTFRARAETSAPEDEIECAVLGWIRAGKTMDEISLELRRSEYETAVILYDLNARGLVEIDQAEAQPQISDPVATIADLLARAYTQLQAQRYSEAAKTYEDVLAIDRINQNAKRGLLLVSELRERARVAMTVPLDKVPVLTRDLSSMTGERFEPQEGFVLSRVNGEWSIKSILRLCPMSEEETLNIFARLIERGVIQLF